MARKKESERQVISVSPKRRPYGVRLSLLLESSTKFNIDGECSLLISPDYQLKISPGKSKDRHYSIDNQCWEVSIEAFATAGEAEQVGLKVSMGFLWAALSGKYSLRLLYNTPLPCSVYDRTKSKGTLASLSASIMVGHNINNVIEPLNRIVSSKDAVDQKLLVALELFASAKLETTERSRFVGIVSSIEPLAQQKKYQNDELERLICLFQKELKDSSLENDLKIALRNKIDFLRMESISMAIRRLVGEVIPDEPDALSIIEEAYSIRSRILHDGATDADLELKGKEAEDIVRKIFAAIVDSFTES